MIKRNSVVEEMRSLIAKLNAASNHYYNGRIEMITNLEFDLLEEQLKKLERETGIILPNSPSTNVGYDINTSRRKIQHEFPSLSLDKTKSSIEMKDWLGEYVGVLSWKCDGLTIILTYDEGKLTTAATRGNGTLGEDVTSNVMTFENIPLCINDTRHIIIRGEALIPYSTFEDINKTLPEDKKYKNPRNMAAGALRFVNSRDTAAYSIEFMAFDLVNARELGFKTFSESLNFIDDLGITTVDRLTVTHANIENVIRKKECEIKKLPYPADGIVVVYDDLASHDILGATRKFPKYAKAFKWKDELKTTILRNIEWSVAKSGLLSPVAVFDPVELEGTIVKRANVHNITIVKEMGLGIGDHIKVYKANMIIPQIYEDVEKSNNIPVPKVCPICGSRLDRRIGSNNRSVFLYCISDNCSR